MGADLGGIWTGQLEGRFGEAEDISFRFVSGPKGLSGKIYNENDSTPIGEVSLEGDHLRFTVTQDLNGGLRKWAYAGIVKGRRIEMQRQRVPAPGQPAPIGTPAPPQKFVLQRLIAAGSR